VTELLSQEEIDALLRGGGSPGDSTAPAGGGAAPPSPPPGDGNTPPTDGGGGGEGDLSNALSKEVLDQLSEVANLSLGATSSVVQMLLNRPIEIAPSQLKVISYKSLANEAGTEEFIIAKISYVEGFDGNSYLMLKNNIAALIGDLMMGGEGKDPQFQDMHKSAVGEMMNQMMGKTTTTLSEIFKKRVDIAPPQVELVNFSAGIPPLPDFKADAIFLRIGFKVKIGDIT